MVNFASGLRCPPRRVTTTTSFKTYSTHWQTRKFCSNVIGETLKDKMRARFKIALSSNEQIDEDALKPKPPPQEPKKVDKHFEEMKKQFDERFANLHLEQKKRIHNNNQQKKTVYYHFKKRLNLYSEAEAEEIFEEFQDNHRLNDDRSYTLLIQLFLLFNNWQRVQDVLQLKQDRKLPNTSGTYFSLMQGYLKCNCEGEALNLLEELKEQGLTITENIGKLFLRYYLFSGNVPKTLEFIQLMQQNDLQFDSFLCKEIARSRMPAAINEIIKIKSALPISPVTVEILLQCYFNLADYNRLESLFAAVKDKSDESINAEVDRAVQFFSITPHSYKVYKSMIKAGYIPTETQYYTFIKNAILKNLFNNAKEYILNANQFKLHLKKSTILEAVDVCTPSDNLDNFKSFVESFNNPITCSVENDKEY